MHNLAVTQKISGTIADRATMAGAIDIVSNVISRKATYPLLASARISGDGDILFVTGCDIDIEIVVAVATMSDSEIDLALNATLFKQMLKNAPKSATSLTIDQPMLEEVTRSNGTKEIAFKAPSVIDFGKVSYTIPVLHPEGYPAIDAKFNTNSAYNFDMPTADFLNAINAVSPAISNEETRYYLNGIYMHTVEDEMRFVATDGHRMLIQKVPVVEGSKGMPGIIIPKDTIYLMQKLLKAKGVAETVSISVSNCHFRVAFDNITITSKLIEGTFPDYERVTPKDNNQLITFGVAAMQEAITAVCAISNKFGGKATKINIRDGAITLSVIHPDNGTSHMSVPAEIAFDHEFEIGFNSSYLIQMMKTFATYGDNVSMNFGDARGPTLLTCDKEGFLGIMMPMRT